MSETQPADLKAAETPTVHTDPVGRILVGAEHPRTVHERIGALSDKATEALLPSDFTTTKGSTLKVALPRTMPATGTALTDADIVALNNAGKGDVVTFDGPRMLPMSDGTYREVREVEIDSPAKNGSLSVKAID